MVTTMCMPNDFGDSFGKIYAHLLVGSVQHSTFHVLVAKHCLFIGDYIFRVLIYKF